MIEVSHSVFDLVLCIIEVDLLKARSLAFLWSKISDLVICFAMYANVVRSISWQNVHVRPERGECKGGVVRTNVLQEVIGMRRLAVEQFQQRLRGLTIRR